MTPGGRKGKWKTRFGLEGVYVVMSAPLESKDDWSGLVWQSKQLWRLLVISGARRKQRWLFDQIWFGNRNKDGGYLVISGARRNRLIIIVGSAWKKKMASIAWHPRSMEKARMTYGVTGHQPIFFSSKKRKSGWIIKLLETFAYVSWRGSVDCSQL